MSNSSSGRRKKVTTTPSGVSYKQFMQMSENERYDLIEKIIDDNNIKVPDYLDNSQTSKVMYALGMNNKPEMVSDKEFDKLKGDAMYRTVNNAKTQTSENIINQIKTSDYTQLSGDASSAYGRGIYFAKTFTESARYGINDKNPIMMRAKIKSNAKIEDYGSLRRTVKNDTRFYNSRNMNRSDIYSLYALAKGLDGWHSKGTGYTVIVNRGSLVTTSTNKKTQRQKGIIGGFKRLSWKTAPDA